MFDTETELPRASNTSALSGAGVLRLFNKVGETVTKIAFKMGESDPVSLFCPFWSINVAVVSLSVRL